MGNTVACFKAWWRVRELEQKHRKSIELDQLKLKQVEEGGGNGPQLQTAHSVGRSAFIIDQPGDIYEFYHLDETKIGEGSFGRVCRANNRSTGHTRAVKVVRKKGRESQIPLIRNEIKILKKLDHPNIVRLYEIYEDKTYIYLVMELCSGGELFDKILEVSHLTEQQTASIMKQILRAVFYMHTNLVCHRDLKLENFCFVRQGALENNTVKVIDFGLSKEMAEEGQIMQTKVGAPYYTAPQVLLGRYTEACDLWTCGVLMYVLMCGYPPFFGESDAEILARVRTGGFSFNKGDWKHVSPLGKEMVRSLLKLVPSERLTAKMALSHQWLVEWAPTRWVPIRPRYIDNLRAYANSNRLKRAAIMMISGQLDDEYTKQHVDMFMMLDESGEGAISAEELRVGMIKAGVEEDEIPTDLEEVIGQVDGDGSGFIDFSEFLAATLDPKVYTREEPCWAAFRLFDRGGDGQIGAKELSDVLGHGSCREAWSKANCKQLIKEVDERGDGYINFEEFMHMMNGSTNLSRHKKKVKKKKKGQEEKPEEPLVDGQLSANEATPREIPGDAR